jgi:heptosyltransferase III
VDFSATKRVLIYRLGSLGDTVVAVPALHVVARAFPNAKRLLLTNTPVHAKAPAASAILESSNLVHGYISYPVGLRGVGPLAKLWWSLRKFHPQLVIYLADPRGTGSIRRDVWFFRMCGVSKVIGLPAGDRSEPLYFPEQGLWERESARLLRSIRELGGSSVEEPNWDLHLTENEKNAARVALAPAAGAPLIVCGPGTKMQAKDWGQENWRQLLARLSAALPGAALALVGAKEDAPVAEYAASGWQGTVLNLCGQLTPRETAAALSDAELFLGPDSGPMHLAAAMGVPCAIAFAARTNPGIWFPAGDRNRIVYHQTDCAGCNLETCFEQNRKCLTSISVDEMLAAALEAWSDGRKDQPEHAV